MKISNLITSVVMLTTISAFANTTTTVSLPVQPAKKESLFDVNQLKTDKSINTETIVEDKIKIKSDQSTFNQEVKSFLENNKRNNVKVKYKNVVL
jgi:hypothetical protein